MNETCPSCGRRLQKTWPDCVYAFISLVPALIVLLLITNSWDSEYLVLGALAGSPFGAVAMKRWRAAES